MRRGWVSLLVLFLGAAGCVREPERDIVGAWDAAIHDARADADNANSDRDETTEAADTDEIEIPDEDGDAFACMWDSCAVHEDCKREGCVATFCTTELGELVPDNPNVCAVRCDPVNNSAECPEGMTCNGQVTLAEQFGKKIDGAKGSCAMPTR